MSSNNTMEQLEVLGLDSTSVIVLSVTTVLIVCAVFKVVCVLCCLLTEHTENNLDISRITEYEEIEMTQVCTNTCSPDTDRNCNNNQQYPAHLQYISELLG